MSDLTTNTAITEDNQFSEVRTKASLAKKSAGVMNRLTTTQKNEALLAMAEALVNHAEELIAANHNDLKRGRELGTSESLLDRLKLTEERIGAIAEGLRQIAALPDPVGDTLEQIERPNGLRIEKIRVPLGVIGIIYEARPNVTVDAAGLCLKTGNPVVLRGGSAALSSNRKIIEVLQQALDVTAVPREALQLIEDSDRASVNEMLTLNGLLDVIIPRGGRSLIQNVVQNATVPVIETGAGVCHTFLDATANVEMAEAITLNAKVQRPSVCNSMETLLVHSDYAQAHLTGLAERFRDAGVELRGCARTRELAPWAVSATEEDYGTEYNDYILNVKVVNNLDEVLEHIARYGTMHSECIVTENKAHAERFLQEVDAAAVYHNASTRFTDGFEFGFGAEIGISTQKLHARGPMGLPALTSTKYRVYGTGQIRE
ncbi:gamma-glutamyl phosphate reductase [Paenibacillus polymyxa]|uniref:Gamma-glutamyl phosphate reductase n=1 Tax=Paenibacillus polymyxa TaxID=1406 RepID=A0A0F6EN50_PAEPO|nr:glutamate-5-semialdehyde dehydrogenase [Paenibacillus polymyxa]AHM66492.1 gamma-glutamyl phosphate reductase [Paenibacillus polymyxa SQR-21]AIY07414.1 gamma-glutamyl phosphate reductase [Paenibacillus polymyxa]MBE7896379.1 glutamate-5-semialdehyde dehydrogenase [Paenibacillus polymyxa]MBG9765709.1 gamma-glutamyl phosphate reductase [Paenibacillus polymyxa]MCC3256907.1 glutamate-5-semialdehyde dehydrogenase [Paenibacillus polymyxa]